MPKEEKISEEVKSRIAVEMKKAQMMTLFLNRGTRWYEGPVVRVPLSTSSVC